MGTQADTIDRDDPTDDPRVLDVVKEYQAELERGGRPDRDNYLGRHPDLAPSIAPFLDSLDLLHRAAQSITRPELPAPRLDTGLAPGGRLGEFEIVREVGRGGMGVVYEAVQTSLGRRVALKVLPLAAALNAKQLQRFQTEAHAAAQLHHPNIVPVYAVGCENGVHYYAMQFIDGLPLEAFIRDLRQAEGRPGGSTSTMDLRAGAAAPARRAPAPPLRTGRSRETYRTLARIAAQVAEALEYAHEAGVVHRDIKPGNLLLDRGAVWVTDFGLAQVTARVGLTQTGDVFGTLRYMSPEQAAGRRLEVDHRTDVYSLGATLYELVTLAPVFSGSDRQRLLHRIFHADPRPPRQVDRSVPVELETIVLKALAKVPADRYATAGELAADLRRFLEDRPILARRPSWAGRARKWVRRHPAVAWTAVALLALNVAGLTASTALVVREQARTQAALDRERERADQAERRFRQAKATGDLLLRVTEEDLGTSTPFQMTRRRLLLAALENYRDLTAAGHDDPEVRAELDRVLARIQSLLAEVAAKQEADRALLLRHPGVRVDLGLTPEQAEGVERALGRQPAGPGSRLPDRPALDAVVRLLTDAQRDRLRQVSLQFLGPGAFSDPDVVERLALTTAQRRQVRVIQAEAYAPQPGRPGPPGRSAIAAAMKHILDCLTPEQQATWRTIVGRPLGAPTGGGS